MCVEFTKDSDWISELCLEAVCQHVRILPITSRRTLVTTGGKRLTLGGLRVVGLDNIYRRI